MEIEVLLRRDAGLEELPVFDTPFGDITPRPTGEPGGCGSVCLNWQVGYNLETRLRVDGG